MGEDLETSESLTGMQKSDPKATVGINEGIIMKGLSVILLLIMLLAVGQLYFSVQEIIGIWLDEDYVPVVNSIYYIIVIVGCIYIISKMQSWRSKGT